ncbi:MAG: hypothetical protein Q9224_000038 [Gallowayella concinna]
MGPRAGLSLLYSQFFVTLPKSTRSFAGQTVIVTGSNGGLGLEAAKQILSLGAAKLILAVRNLQKGEDAKTLILQSSSPPASAGLIEVWELDLSNYATVVAFSKRAEAIDKLDAVIQNAGISTHDFTSAGGFESSLTVNVISTFLLTLLLLPLLHSSATKHNTTPCISIVTSSVHNFTNLPAKSAFSILTEMNKPKSQLAPMSTRYFDTKLLQVLYTRALADALPKGKTDGGKVVVNMLNPGLCDSGLFKQPSKAFKLQIKLMGRTAEEGSRALVDAVARGKESHGEYLSDCRIYKVSDWVQSEEGKKTQARLWREVNEALEQIVPGVVGNALHGLDAVVSRF